MKTLLVYKFILTNINYICCRSHFQGYHLVCQILGYFV